VQQNLTSESNSSEIQFLSRNGKIKSFIGAIAIFNCEYRVCIKVDGNKSFWVSQKTNQIFEEKLLIGEILFRDIFSKEFFKPWSKQGVENFLASIPADASEQNKQPETTEENNMATKTGKIALAKELLKAGKTPAQVAARLVQSFKIEPQTAKNTTAWCRSMLKKESAAE